MAVIVLINPKSGGNEGTKLKQDFTEYVDEARIYDLTETGPKAALEQHRTTPNLKIIGKDSIAMCSCALLSILYSQRIFFDTEKKFD